MQEYKKKNSLLQCGIFFIIKHYLKICNTAIPITLSFCEIFLTKKKVDKKDTSGWFSMPVVLNINEN